MNKSKLISTLKLFSQEELCHFEQFLSSPYFEKQNNHEELHKLFKYIFKYWENWDNPALQKDNVYLYVFGNGNRIKGKLDKLMTGLLTEIHRFVKLHFNRDLEDEVKSLIGLSDFFRQRKAPKLANFYLDKAKKNHRQIVIQDGQYHYNSFLLATEQLPENLMHQKLFDAFDFKAAWQTLDVYYLQNKLDTACVLLSYDRFRKKIDVAGIVDFLNGVKSHYQSQGVLEIPIINIYYRAYELLNKPGKDELAYWELKSLILENEPNIPFDSLKTLWGVARNFIIKRYNQGAIDLLEELFTLHKQHLEKKYLDYGNGILPGALKNLVTLGLRAKEFDWVYSILERFKNNITGISAKEVYKYNLATYHFARKEFNEALALLADKYDDIHYKITAKRLEIKILFEADSEILESKMDAFKIYIYRLSESEILNFKRDGNNNFIDMLRQLYNPKTLVSESRQIKLKQKIETIEQLPERDWFQEKISEFMN